MGLLPGDVHMHKTPTSNQYWLYTEDKNQKLSWISIDLGYQRSLDRRYLSLTPKHGNLSFVGDNWAHRQINDTIAKGTRCRIVSRSIVVLIHVTVRCSRG